MALLQNFMSSFGSNSGASAPTASGSSTAGAPTTTTAGASNPWSAMDSLLNFQLGGAGGAGAGSLAPGDYSQTTETLSGNSVTKTTYNYDYATGPNATAVANGTSNVSI